MRLSDEEVVAIKTAARRAFGDDAMVRLFGSRVHNHLRGGDIDLLIEVDRVENEVDQKAAFEESFWRATEPRKVDVLVAVRGQPYGAFQRIALRDGVIL